MAARVKHEPPTRDAWQNEYALIRQRDALMRAHTLFGEAGALPPQIGKDGHDAPVSGKNLGGIAPKVIISTYRVAHPDAPASGVPSKCEVLHQKNS